MEREDPRDAFVSNRHASLAELPQGAVVGTSSLRRVVQLPALRPDLRIEPLRGNLDTRLRKLDEGQYDAIVLAAAGLKRLGLGARIRALFEPAQMLPCAGQGALGIEVRSDDRPLLAALAPLAHQADLARGRGRARGVARARRQLQHAAGGACRVARRRARAAAVLGHRRPPSAPLLRATARRASVRANARPKRSASAAGAAIARATAPRPIPGRCRSGRRDAGHRHPARAAQAQNGCKGLQAHGIDATALPLIDIAGAPDPAAVTAALGPRSAAQLVVFVSPNAAQAFFGSAPAGRGGRRGLRRPRRGPARPASSFAWACRRRRSSSRPPTRCSSIPKRCGRGFPATTGARRPFSSSAAPAAATGSRSASSSAAPASISSPPMRGPRRRSAPTSGVAGSPALAAAARHLWLFSSSEAIDQLVALAPAPSIDAGRWREARAVATHPRIAARAQQAGFGRVIEARPTLAAVVACIQSIRP